MHAELTAIWGDPISTYGRAEAIEDGCLVDVSHAAKALGWKADAAITPRVAEVLSLVGHTFTVSRALVSLLEATKRAFLADEGAERVDFRFVSHPVYATIDGDGVTILCEGED